MATIAKIELDGVKAEIYQIPAGDLRLSIQAPTQSRYLDITVSDTFLTMLGAACTKAVADKK